MREQVNKANTPVQTVAPTTVSSKYEGGEAAFGFKDERSSGSLQMKFQHLADNSPQSTIQAQMQQLAAKRTTPIIQKKNEESANNTGLPNQLKSGIESLSGQSLDDVKVHYNSDKPAQLNAHAYAQGTQIHLAPQQEKHLPHEAWHVVQQKQGRVRPTMQMKGAVNINDDHSLEREADQMGAKATQLQTKEEVSLKTTGAASRGNDEVAQLMFTSLVLPGTPNQLTITYTDALERDITDDVYSNLDISNDFEEAAMAMGLNDQVLAADRKYQRNTVITSANFRYEAYWDSRTSRLMVIAAEYIGHGAPPAFLVPTAIWRQGVQRESGVTIRQDDLASMDWLYTSFGLRLDAVRILSSSGEVITFVPAGGNYVYQYYKSAAVFVQTARALQGVQMDGIAAASVLGDPALRILRVDKVLPLNQLPRAVPASATETASSSVAAASTETAASSESVSAMDVRSEPRPITLQEYVASNAERIFTQVRQVILNLSKSGISQGDVSIDNLGLRADVLTLFDFNMLRPASAATIREDILKLIASIKHNGGKVPDFYDSNPTGKGPWG